MRFFYDNKKVIKMLCAFDIIPKTLYQIFDMTIKAMYMYMKTKQHGYLTYKS